MKKIGILVSVIMLSLFCLMGNVSNAKEIEEETVVNVIYELNREKNTVVAKMISNKELQPTKKSWNLSPDRKQYTFEFNRNTTYDTNVVDIDGNVISVKIEVKDVDESPANVAVKYELNKEKNTVVAKMISDKELQPTKVSWKLSENKKEYTFEFDRNTTYTTNVVDVYGNVVPVNIEVVDIDESPANLVLEYESNIETNTIIAKVKSNKELQPTKISWELSEDKKEYTFEFNGNTTYTTNFVDKYGNVISVEIKIETLNETKLEVKYEYKETTNTVLVTVTSNNGFKPTKASWKLNKEQTQYSFEFNTNTRYTTNFVDKYGKVIPLEINVDKITIKIERGTYGASGAKIHGVNGGSDLEYLRFGNGDNVLFATFCVHGYEDSWDRDGTVLVNIANNFYDKLVREYDTELARDWTIYIFREVNPDGRRLGETNDGPGRTTLYSKLGKGMDINRCWQTGSEYKTYTGKRNYNGTAGFQAYEAEALRDFLLTHQSKTGKNVVIDLHGWENQLIGDEQICKYYKQQYSSCATRNYGKYGTQYLITWARQVLGAKVALVELPKANNYAEVEYMGLSDKYINATIEMLKNEKNKLNTRIKAKKARQIISSDFEVAFCGMIKKSKPSFEEIEDICKEYEPIENGVWINTSSRDEMLEYLNNSEKFNSKYNIDKYGYLRIEEVNNQSDKDKEIEKMISGNKKYILDISDVYYMIDPVTGDIVDNPYNDLDGEQTYDYCEDGDRVIVFISEIGLN